MQSIISIDNVSKSYGRVQALKNVSFNVPEGSVFGILGPNGSGKTTILGILLDVLKADAGNYSWFGGMAPEKARRQIGAILETPNFYHYLSAIDNLKIAAAIKQRGEGEYDVVLEKTGLLQRKHSKFQTYSLGMKQRLAIASALLGSPEVLVLDEPTNGLDPAGIAEIRALIQELNQSGVTVIMASHLLDEVEKVCTHVAILKRGNLLLDGPVDEVLRSEDEIEIMAADAAALQQLITTLPNVGNVRRNGNIIAITCSDGINTATVNKFCADKGMTLSHLVLKKKSLETKFMELTNQA